MTMALIKEVFLRFTPSVSESEPDFKGYRIYSYKSPAVYKPTDAFVTVAKGAQIDAATGEYKIPVSSLITGLPVVGKYSFVVVVEDSTGNLSDEAVLNDITIDVTAPTKVTNLRVL